MCSRHTIAQNTCPLDLVHAFCKKKAQFPDEIKCAEPKYSNVFTFIILYQSQSDFEIVF